MGVLQRSERELNPGPRLKLTLRPCGYSRQEGSTSHTAHRFAQPDAAERGPKHVNQQLFVFRCYILLYVVAPKLF